MTDDSPGQSRRERFFASYTYLSYRVLNPIADYVSDETDYSDYMQRGNIGETTRVYIARTIADSVLVGLLMILLSTVLFFAGIGVLRQINTALSVVQTAANVLLSASNPAFVLVASISSSIATVQASISLNQDVFQIVQNLVGVNLLVVDDTLARIGRQNPAIGAVLLAVSRVLQAVQGVAAPVVETVRSINVSQLFASSASSQQGTSVVSVAQEALSAVPSADILYKISLVILTPLSVVGTLAWRLGKPYYTAGERSRKIESNLPRAVTFMYALSAGGQSITAIMYEIADAKDAYGEVSVEFQRIIRQLERSDADMTTVLKTAAKRTPSREFEEFLQEFASVIDTGSDIGQFLLSRSEQSMEEARERQQNYLQLFELLAEGYIIMFVAAPIFVLILQLVTGFVGNLNKGIAQAVAYLFVPAGGGLIAMVIYITGSARRLNFSRLEQPSTSYEHEIKTNPDSLITDPQYLPYRLGELLKSSRQSLLSPLRSLRNKPRNALLITIPIVLAYVLVAVQFGFIPTQGAVLQEQYFQLTVSAYYIPMMILMLPWSILYELKKRRKQATSRRLPTLFQNIAEANKRGLTLEESMRSASKSGDGQLYQNLRQAMRQSSMTGDLNRALAAFANSARVPRLSQAIRLMMGANTVSSDVTAVVEIIADDLSALYDLRRNRRQRSLQYVAIITISFLISAGVLFALNLTFFDFVQQQIQDQASQSGGGSRGPSSFGSGLSIPFFRRVFFHTLLSLGLISGFVAGLMQNNRVENGFKYTIVMTTLGIAGTSFVV